MNHEILSAEDNAIIFGLVDRCRLLAEANFQLQQKNKELEARLSEHEKGNE